MQGLQTVPESLDPADYLGLERPCECGQVHRVPTRSLRLERGLLSRLPGLIRALGPQVRVHVVTHQEAWAALGVDLLGTLGAGGFQTSATIYGAADLVPDEEAQAVLEQSCPPDTELLLAVGSGVVHDLTRNEAHRRGLPFDSVPTAPSMDGYASTVAPLVLQGFKVTVASSAPRAIWGDLDVLSRCPWTMAAAGIGDLMGKSICLRDWELGALLTGEWYCPFVARLMEGAWDRVRGQLTALRRRDPDATRVLMESLVLSGMGMVMAGSSRPASGAEHHLSHYWELMGHLKGFRTPLHGLKVAAGTLLVAREVRRLKRRLDGSWREAPLVRDPRWQQEATGALGPLAPAVLHESFGADALRVGPGTMERHLPAVRSILGRVPGPATVRSWLVALGLGPSLGWLGVPRSEVAGALRWAPLLRNRFTVLRLRDQAPVGSGFLRGAALTLVAANLLLGGILVSAGVVATQAWKGDPSALRDLSSRWVDAPGGWRVDSSVHNQRFVTRWDGDRWVMSSGDGTAQESTRTLP